MAEKLKSEPDQAFVVKTTRNRTTSVVDSNKTCAQGLRTLEDRAHSE